MSFLPEHFSHNRSEKIKQHKLLSHETLHNIHWYFHG